MNLFNLITSSKVDPPESKDSGLSGDTQLVAGEATKAASGPAPKGAGFPTEFTSFLHNLSSVKSSRGSPFSSAKRSSGRKRRSKGRGDRMHLGFHTPLRESVFSMASVWPGSNITELRTGNQVYNRLVYQQEPGWVSTSTSGPVYYARYFSSADISDFTAWSTVFDQYRITRVQAWIAPRFLPSGLPSTGSPQEQGLTVSAIDYDDASQWTSYSQGLNYQNAIVGGAGFGHYRDWIPHLAIGVYGGSVFTNFGNAPDLWVDCASTTAQWYGLKFAVTQTDEVSYFDLSFRLFVQFRNSR